MAGLRTFIIRLKEIVNIEIDDDEEEYLDDTDDEEMEDLDETDDEEMEDPPEVGGGSMNATPALFIADVGAHFSTFLALSFAALPSLETIQIDVVSENRQDTFSRTGWWF